MAMMMVMAASARDLVGAGSNSTWKYFDASPAPADGWNDVSFDDSHWKSGAAPLGYGETRLQTKVCDSTDQSQKPVTTWFRRKFDAADIKAGERWVLLLCVDDGAVAYLNGREIGRLNLPRGSITSATKAKREVSSEREGFYIRVPVPAGVIRPQLNVLAVEVHQATTNDEDLFFDASLKTLPSTLTSLALTSTAREAMNTFRRQHYLGPSVPIPDGYIDGGRHMALSSSGKVESGREILLVDRARDVELARHLAFARSPEVKSLEPLQRMQRLAAYIDRVSTPPGGAIWIGPSVDQLTHEFANQPLLLGDVLDQCQAGVCRHRALLFKVMADAAGLGTSIVRGNYSQTGKGTFAHAWNEVFLGDSRRVLVDVMHHGGKPVFPEITSAYVVNHYFKEDDTPWYGEKTKRP